MKTLTSIGLAVLLSSPVYANEQIPEELARFIAEREICEHFRQEPQEGNSPEMQQRRAFINQNVQSYCQGTDCRLSTLKQRYQHNSQITSLLMKYDPKIETTNNTCPSTP